MYKNGTPSFIHRSLERTVSEMKRSGAGVMDSAKLPRPVLKWKRAKRKSYKLYIINGPK
jgi:hypothetical protein